MKAALQALELLRNADDTQQEVSHNFDNDFEQEMEIPN